MSLTSHIESLNTKLSQIDQSIHDAYVHHQPTHDLKKQKLHLLDEIEKLSHGDHRKGEAA